MEWLVIFFGGLLIGLTLGLTGSGGSILTVPVLVYLVGHPDKVAIAESMLIVGAIALVTVIPYARSGETDWGRVLYFGIPGVLGAFLGKLAGDHIDGSILLMIFGGIVLASATLMLLGKGRPVEANKGKASCDAAQPDAGPNLQTLLSVMGQGIAVGFVTGLVGVGGGFLIVPALVLLGKLPMRRAVGTSLAIIALNAASGFFFQIPRLQQTLRDPHMELSLSALASTIMVFILIGIGGSFVGRRLSTKINQNRLRKGFACFLLVMGVLILAKEIQRQQTETSTSPTEVATSVESRSQHPPTTSRGAQTWLQPLSKPSLASTPSPWRRTLAVGSLLLEENA